KRVKSVIKDKVSQENVSEKEAPLNNNIGKQIGDFVDMPSEAVEQGMDANVPDEIDGAKGEQGPNHVVKKCNLEFLRSFIGELEQRLSTNVMVYKTSLELKGLQKDDMMRALEMSSTALQLHHQVMKGFDFYKSL
nr:hypothetical protein [Tanacetum cinerariifolium]